MDKKEFKTIFTKYGKQHGFERAYGGWFKESAETIIVLDLQKSNYGDYFQLNFKVYIQGMLGNQYQKNKDLVKKDFGDILLGPSQGEYTELLNFENGMTDAEREIKTEGLFVNYIVPLVEKTLSIEGIKKMVEDKEISLFPAVAAELKDKF